MIDLYKSIQDSPFDNKKKGGCMEELKINNENLEDKIIYDENGKVKEFIIDEVILPDLQELGQLIKENERIKEQRNIKCTVRSIKIHCL